MFVLLVVLSEGVLFVPFVVETGVVFVEVVSFVEEVVSLVVVLSVEVAVALSVHVYKKRESDK